MHTEGGERQHAQVPMRGKELKRPCKGKGWWGKAGGRGRSVLFHDARPCTNKMAGSTTQPVPHKNGERQRV